MNYSTVRVKYEYSRTSSSTVRVRVEGGYSYGTVPALFTIRFGRAETVPVLVRVRSRGILFEIQYGTRTVQYSTIAYFLQDLEEQKRTKYKINGTVAYCLQGLGEQKRTKYKINGTATTAIEKSNPNRPAKSRLPYSYQEHEQGEQSRTRTSTSKRGA